MASRLWTSEEDAILVRLWPTDPARNIGALMGKTKNAIIGRAGRLGLENKRARAGQMQARAPHSRRRATPQPEKREPTLKRVPPMVIAPPEPVPGGLHIMQLEPHHCREVIGRGTPDLLPRYCGAPKQAGSSFCAGHHAINYQPLNVTIH